MDFNNIAYGLSDEDKAAFSAKEQDETARRLVREAMSKISPRAQDMATLVIKHGSRTGAYQPHEAVIMLLLAAAIVHKSMDDPTRSFDHIGASGASTDPEIEDAINLFIRSATDEICAHTLRVKISRKDPDRPGVQIRKQAEAHLKRKGLTRKPKPEPEAEKKND